MQKITKPIATPKENGQLNVLITRPVQKAKQLALLLDQQGIANISQPLFDYKNNTTSSKIEHALAQADIAIFVSVAAVEYAFHNFAFKNYQNIHFIAVGQATKRALLTAGISDVLVPEEENSEGVLLLPLLQKVHNKNVVIFRGNGGREHLATKLNNRGAQVCYIESYQRVWRTLAKDISQQWQAKQINCIVVTSNDNLMKMIDLLHGNNEALPTYWQYDCVWIVVSDRIKINAKELGLTQVVNCESANSKIIANTIKALVMNKKN